MLGKASGGHLNSPYKKLCPGLTFGTHVVLFSQFYTYTYMPHLAHFYLHDLSLNHIQ
jgi:hypothetical protein